MAIVKPKSAGTASKAVAKEAFINAAPDGVRKGVRKGNKQQISLTIAPGLLDKVDAMALELGQSRAAVINMAIYRAVEHGLLKE